ncbi:MAG: amidohydrolase family protein [Myxococcota bacterium]|jgi:imidazolonepropionase-like amidohydrolase|nr:amidohydrolase family protein [Myxococcota bacterium]
MRIGPGIATTGTIPRHLVVGWIDEQSLAVNVMENLKNLYRMGANVGIGSDIGNPWTQFFGRYKDELQHFANAGIPNADILRRATSLNAQIIDMQDEIGSIAKGKRADLIAVKGDPLVDLHALSAVDVIVKGGTFVKADGIALT